MEKKENKKVYDLRAAKKIFEDYLEKGQEVHTFKQTEDTVKIDDLTRKDALNRIYSLVDNIITQIYKYATIC